jgi:methylthioribose-1-phosphate isomerase
MTMQFPGQPVREAGDDALRTLRVVDDAPAPSIETLDQTRLPFEERWVRLRSFEDCLRAIASMQVRGAPLIGAVGAYGLALGLRKQADDASLALLTAGLVAARPTAVNLAWAVGRVRDRVAGLAFVARAVAAWVEACAIAEEDVRINRALGEHGAQLLRRLVRPGRPLRILTHCNAGRLATVAYGTALAPVYRLHADAVPVEVWVDETRPRNQGASLTAWELSRAGITCTVVADNAGGELMRQGLVDAVIVGCDRIAANGDVANKVGTYLKALAARDCGVPFYVACPSPTLDLSLPAGGDIPIEERSPREVTHVVGRDAQGAIVEVQLVPDGVPARNPAFDVTPAALVTAIVTEHGPVGANAADLAALAALAARQRREAS